MNIIGTAEPNTSLEERIHRSTFMRDRGIKTSFQISEEIMVYIINGVDSTVLHGGK